MKTRAIRGLVGLSLAALLVLMSACGGPGTRQDARHSMLFSYQGAIRWGHFDDAWTMVDPEYAQKHPLTSLERERFEQIEVTSYQVKGTQHISDTEFVQQVEIRLVNRHTLVERTILDHQLWRWDSDLRRWWLTTGLPDITAGR